MAGNTPFFASEILGYLTGQEALATTLTPYLGLFTTMPSGTASGTEVSGLGYARIEVNGSSFWNAPVQGSPTSVTNSATFTFPNATVLSPPANPTLSSTAGGTLAATTYYVIITYVGASGETTGSGEVSLAVAADNLLVVDSPAASSGAVGWNVYVGTASGGETKQNSSYIAIGTNWTEPTTGLISGSAVPTTNTASWGNILGVGLWDASTGGDLLYSGWLGNAKYWPFTATTSGNLISAYGITAGTTGFANGVNVIFSEGFGGTAPTGLALNTLYTVSNLSSDTFTVGATLTANGSGNVRMVVPQTMVPNNRLQINAGEMILQYST